MKAIDPAFVRQLASELPRDAFIGVVRTFQADLARLVQQMVASSAAGEMEAYRRGAHGLAGAAGSIGARRLEELARRAMLPDSAAAPDSVGVLEDEAASVLSELAGLIAAPPPARA
ncbi:Hpt domain-containing protein [Roseomonas marmotae]|uniref:Hpt domain-containing protein n=1 Tax=Roseomonas marmotae TaxID=2768161 RepID=A0ABS3KE63_9PROT|nr:Hpt domain-containing protein [Roseomonas marmotae]MBO1075766.1 Hpt domain-containing protein [Roseomonas marmotae]QTI80493.1 Hpt domain-containing protein [Roseomonas marmotae]